MSTFRVTVNPSPDDGHRQIRFYVNPTLACDRDRYGVTAQEIANSVAGEYCDSGSILVEGAGDSGLVARR